MRKINEQQKITLILSDYAHETLRNDNRIDRRDRY